MYLTMLIALMSGGPLMDGVQVSECEHEGIRYHAVEVAPEAVELHWKAPDGRPYRQFSALEQELHNRLRDVVFMMNAGIFMEDGTPLGLLVIGGETLRPLNERTGYGNFYLKPNGVFYVDEGGAHVVTSTSYASDKPRASLAVQSGPMLVIDGAIHSAFRQGSANRLHRNGVGVKEDGKVLFAISEPSQARLPNLYEFASFFLSRGCKNALYLDGVISDMAVCPAEPIAPGMAFGAIFAITKERGVAPRQGPLSESPSAEPAAAAASP